jgi:hypothetical protein
VAACVCCVHLFVQAQVQAWMLAQVVLPSRRPESPMCATPVTCLCKDTHGVVVQRAVLPHEPQRRHKEVADPLPQVLPLPLVAQGTSLHQTARDFVCEGM